MIEVLKPSGFYTFELFDKNGKLKHKEIVPNGVTTVGKAHMLNTVFNGGTAVATWYIGLIDNTSYSALAAGDTMASHAGWIEAHTIYDEATRVAWVEGTTTTASITSSTVSTFTMNNTATLRGIFITSVSTKGGTTGTLWSTALFAAATVVADDDQIKITYTVNLT